MAYYLVTGGAGFIGSHLVESLLADGHQVRVLDDLSTGKMANLPPQVEFQFGDVGDFATVLNAMQAMDGCFHLAAIASVQRSNEDWLGTHRINQTGSVHVFEAARQVSDRPIPVVYASSAAVYGEPSQDCLTEQARTEPLTAYGADKLGSELHARVATLVHQVPTFGCRFFNVYGPRQDPASPYSGVISIFAQKILNQQDISIHGDGLQLRDFIYVGDVVRHLRAALDKANASQPLVANVCTGISTSILQLAETLAQLCATRANLKFTSARMGDIRQSLGDPAYAESLLALGSRVELADGLQRLLASLQA